MKLNAHEINNYELFDLRTDPGEKNNLLENPTHHKTSISLEKKLQHWKNEIQLVLKLDQTDKTGLNLNPEIIKQVKALGYVE